MGGPGVSGDEPILLDWPAPQVARIHLNRPDRLNALLPEMVVQLRERLLALDAEVEGCRVVVLTGSGRGFCAGLDLVAAVERNGVATSIPEHLRSQEHFAGMIQAIRSIRQPVIAAVNGPAAGAGMGLALAADIRLATPDAQFHVAAVKIGLSAGECGISYFLPRLIGAGRAFEVMLTGRPVKADEAERIGLVTRVVPDDELQGAALETAAAIIANSPFGIWMTKTLMYPNLDADSLDEAIALENRTQILAVTTGDSREAMSAFVDKRKPQYRGK